MKLFAFRMPYKMIIVYLLKQEGDEKEYFDFLLHWTLSENRTLGNFNTSEIFWEWSFFEWRVSELDKLVLDSESTKDPFPQNEKNIVWLFHTRKKNIRKMAFKKCKNNENEFSFRADGWWCVRYSCHENTLTQTHMHTENDTL